MRELWGWIDGLPWLVVALVVWLAAALVFGVLVGKLIRFGNPSDEGER